MAITQKEGRITIKNIYTDGSGKMKLMCSDGFRKMMLEKNGIDIDDQNFLRDAISHNGYYKYFIEV